MREIAGPGGNNIGKPNLNPLGATELRPSPGPQPPITSRLPDQAAIGHILEGKQGSQFPLRVKPGALPSATADNSGTPEVMPPRAAAAEPPQADESHVPEEPKTVFENPPTQDPSVRKPTAAPLPVAQDVSPETDVPSRPEEHSRIEQLGYTIPTPGPLPSYPEVLDSLELHPLIASEAPTNATLILEELGSGRDVSPESYISVATQVLREKGYSEDALDYTSQVALPALMALHGGHEGKGYTGVVQEFTASLANTDTPVPHTLATVQQHVERAIDFVEHRDDIIPAANQVLHDWVDATREGTVQSNIVGLVQTGSYVRGDAHYLSDMDVMVVADGEVTEADYREFTTFVRERLDQIDPALVGMDVWPNPVENSPVFQLQNLRELAIGAEYDTSFPDYSSNIIAINEATRERIATSLGI